jgi:hypothetical protein
MSPRLFSVIACMVLVGSLLGGAVGVLKADTVSGIVTSPPLTSPDRTLNPPASPITTPLRVDACFPIGHRCMGDSQCCTHRCANPGRCQAPWRKTSEIQ